MADWLPTPLATDRTDSTLLAVNHPADHDAAQTALNNLRTQIGAEPGTDIAGKQPLDADLTAIAALVSAADKLPYATGAGTWAMADLTAFARTLIDDANAGAARTTLGLGTAATAATGDFDAAGAAAAAQAASQPLDADLTAIAGLTSAADRLPYFTGSGAAALATFTAAGRALVDDADAAAQRTTLGLVIGTDVQAYDADLASIAALATTSYGRSFLTLADAAAARTLTGAADDTLVVHKAGAETLTGLKAFSAGLNVTDDDGTTTVNGYRALAFLQPPTVDEEVAGLVFKVPDPTYGVGQDYAEGNAWVALSDAANTVTAPTPILVTITTIANSGGLVKITATAHGYSTGDVVRIAGTGQGALDNLWWKITRVDADNFTLDGSTYTVATNTAGRAFSDRSAVAARLDAQGGLGVNAIHCAIGLRGRAGQAYTVGQAAVDIDPSGDFLDLILRNATTSELATTPTSEYLIVQDTRSSPTRSLVKVEADGMVTMRPQSGKAAATAILRARDDGDTADTLLIRADGGLWGKMPSAFGKLAPVSTTELAIQANGDTHLPFACFASSATQSADLFNVLSSAGAIYHRFNKDGYLLNRKTTTPAVGDMVNNECGMRLDTATPAIVFFARIGGVLKTVSSGTLV